MKERIKSMKDIYVDKASWVLLETGDSFREKIQSNISVPPQRNRVGFSPVINSERNNWSGARGRDGMVVSCDDDVELSGRNNMYR